MDDSDNLRALIERVARIGYAEEWETNLNPAQRGVLAYLMKANRFSRAPSQVADFMMTTRGTASQTLKALSRKGLVAEVRSTADRRSISYEITPEGEAELQRPGVFDTAIDGLDPQTRKRMSEGLAQLARVALKRRGFRPFGLCATCKYHRRRRGGGYCDLLKEPLTEQEARLICHEHDYV